MTKKPQTSKEAAEKVAKNIRRKTRQTCSSEENIRFELAENALTAGSFLPACAMAPHTRRCEECVENSSADFTEVVSRFARASMRAFMQMQQ